MAKSFLFTYFKNLEAHNDFAITFENGLDIGSAIVESRFRIFNKRRDGSIGNQLKYTVNCYNTSSKMLINGSKVEIFVENILQMLLNLISKKETHLNHLNTNIKSQIAMGSVEKWAPTESSQSNGNQQVDNSLALQIINDAENSNAINYNESIYLCPICQEQAIGTTIECEQCDEWINLSCSGMKVSDINKISENHFICRICIENDLYSIHTQASIPTNLSITQDNTARDEILMPDNNSNDYLMKMKQ